MTPTQSRGPKRVLVRLPNWVGDIMMSLSAVQSLRQALPESHIVGMARRDHLELARRISALDEVVAAPPQSGSDRHRAIWQTTRELRAFRFDLAVLLATSFEAALTVWLAGIPVRLGHDTDRRAALINQVVAIRDGHRADVFQDLASALGGQPTGGGNVLRCTVSDREAAERLLQEAGVEPGVMPVFVNPASAKKPRAWSSDSFRQLVEAVAKRHDGTPILVHDRHPFEAPKEWSSSRRMHTVSNASLVELASVMERCALYVGNDSGPMHIAAAMGVPTIGIYGPSSPERTSPRGAEGAAHIAVSASFECSPCRERFFEECPSPPSADGRPPCLNKITVDRVVAEVDRFLLSQG